jgi:hypothetical protein
MLSAILTGVVSMLTNKGMNVLSNAIEGGTDKVLDMVEEKTGIKLNANTPLSTKDVEKLKVFEQANESELLAYHSANTNGARKLQVEALKQEDLFSKRYVYYLASFWSVVAVLYIFLITFIDIPLSNVRFADTVLGFLLGTIVAGIINYFFGSSQGSKDKNDLLQSLKGK